MTLYKCLIIIIIMGKIINNNNNFIDNVLTIKILFIINSLLKKSISSKHYLQFL